MSSHASFHMPPSPYSTPRPTDPAYAFQGYPAYTYDASIPGQSAPFYPVFVPISQHHDAYSSLMASFNNFSLSPARLQSSPQLPEAPSHRQEAAPRARHEQGRRRHTSETRQRQYAEAVRRTVYICDIDPQVTEAMLAELFTECGGIMDCRVCGDPHTAMRFAFIEFEDEAAVRKAISLTGKSIGNCSLRVRPSKTAIVPVNSSMLPRTDEEHQLCARTIYAANIDKRIDRLRVRQFFESLCGPISRLRLLGDSNHSTSIAFVEFVSAESAEKALSCSGALLGSLPIRVAPSKTPVRPDPRDAREARDAHKAGQKGPGRAAAPEMAAGSALGSERGPTYVRDQ